jgi:abortive infection bacteriophage resistance protein
MGNKATSIEIQIELLQKRGMKIDCIDKAKEYLLDIGYYRLGFYWHYFEKDEDHNFHPDTELETVRELYYFDFDLKYLLSKYIYRIEVHFRTQLVYYASNKYPNTPTWFIDKKLVDNDLIAFIENLYHGSHQKFIKYNSPLKKHHEKYINDKYAPAWKTLEFFTFGQINKVFKYLKDETLKSEIAAVYGYRNVSAFENHVNSMVNIRNICSHNGILFDYNQPKGVKKIPKEEYKIKERSQTNLNASISVILSTLSTISENRTVELKAELDKLFSKASQNDKLKQIIDSKIGYKIN